MTTKTLLERCRSAIGVWNLTDEQQAILSDLDAAIAQQAPEINQCDGCQRGLPKTEFGNHQDAAGYIGCTADRYKTAQQAEPVAHVPVHPRNGPLWVMTTATPHHERLPQHYPLLPLYAAPQPPSAELVDERAAFEAAVRNAEIPYLDVPSMSLVWDFDRGRYWSSKTHAAFCGWQTRAALQTPPAPSAHRIALEDIAAMTFDPWSNGAKAGEIAKAALQTRGKNDSEVA